MSDRDKLWGHECLDRLLAVGFQCLFGCEPVQTGRLLSISKHTRVREGVAGPGQNCQIELRMETLGLDGWSDPRREISQTFDRGFEVVRCAEVVELLSIVVNLFAPDSDFVV